MVRDSWQTDRRQKTDSSGEGLHVKEDDVLFVVIQMNKG
jgi:hypothetical protein